MNCNHIVAHGYEDSYSGFIYSKKAINEQESNCFDNWFEYFKKYHVKDLKDEYYKTHFKDLSKYIENKITLFNHCPICGKNLEYFWEQYFSTKVDMSDNVCS